MVCYFYITPCHVHSFVLQYSKGEKIMKNQAEVKVRGVKNMRRMLPYYKGYGGWVFATVVTMIARIALSVIAPLFLAQVLIGFTDADYDKIILNLVCMSASYLLADLLSPVVTIFTEKWVRGGANNLQSAVFKNYVNTTNEKLDKITSGQALSRIGNDATSLSRSFRRLLSQISTSISGIIYLGIGIFVNVWVAIFLIAHLLIQLTVIMIIENKRATKSLVLNKYSDEINSMKNEAVRGIKDIKLLGLKRAICQKVDGANQSLANKTVKYNIEYSWLGFVPNFIDGFFRVGFFALCALLMYKGELTLASFLVLYMYKDNITNSMYVFSNMKAVIAEGEMRAIRVFEFFDEQNYPKDKFGDKDINISGAVAFQDVNFSYEDGTKILDGMNFAIKPNTFVAFVGESGAGKSTILSLITKGVEPQSGKVLLDGYDLNELSEKTLSDGISYVSQSPYIFNMSVKENLRLAKEDATDDEIRSACQAADIADFVEGLGDGYDTLLGENGIFLSGGQKQRIAIARALLKDSKIIIFDETTSALDNITQEKIKQTIYKLKKEHTIIFVAHRLSTVVDADEIMFVEKGKIAMTGTHKKLIEECSGYKQLYLCEDAINDDKDD